MPAIRAVHTQHPTTGEDGLWFELTSPWGLVGAARSAWPAVPGGNPNTRLQRFQGALNAALQALCETRMPMSSILADDPIKLIGPEVGCRIDGTDYVCQIVKVTIPVLSISPSIVLGPVTVEEAASRSEYV